MRLCFGVFAKVLNLCRLPNVTDKEIVGTLTLTVDPNCEYNKSTGSTVSRLLSCEQNLSNGMERRTKQKQKNNHQDFETGLLTNRLSNVVKAAQEANRSDVIERFKETVVGLIDGDKTVLAVRVLLDIINNDETLNVDKENATKFENYVGKTKNALLEQSEFVFADFLVGVFLYTAVAVKNSVGKDTAKLITAEYLKTLSKSKPIKIVKSVSERSIVVPKTMSFNREIRPIASASGNTFDQQVYILDEIMKVIIETLGKNRMKVATQEDWQDFYFALQETARLGREQSEATGELKTFINNITSLYKDWEEVMMRHSENLPADNASDVFERIIKETDTYLFFREVLPDSNASTANTKEKPNFTAYLNNTKGKYSTIKTLLYNDQPKPFYDFYVCNDIKRSIPVPGRFGTSYKCSTIGNVTAKSLMSCSRFVILAGTGGLGKSMMMRHLLINSIETYTDLGMIPVFIPLKDFDNAADGLFNYVFSKVTSLCAEITEAHFDDALNKGKCLLLFDGLDEIGSTFANLFERELEVFTDKYPENYYVISSRPYQTFISYSRFTVLDLNPFSKKQALMLIDNLEFREDEPIIKEKFRNALDTTLFNTHNAFTQNPLLLTIMLLTFEQYAEVPSKMHLFYKEAFAALSVKHDASKGAYKRVLKTGLAADRFADYFAEFCSRSYYDEKFEVTEEEFAKYYSVLKECEKTGDNTTRADDYLYDLCSNMCLMYLESGKYHFTHRSFQEYFCALYFSKQKDKNLQSIGDFFENRKNRRMFGDKTFNMLYDMIPDKIEEYIFVPFLDKLYNRCDEAEGYWTFLEIIYPHICYENGDVDMFSGSSNSPKSYLFDFMKSINKLPIVKCEEFPHYDELVTAEYVNAYDENEDKVLVNKDELTQEYKNEYGIPDTVGWIYEFDIDAIRNELDEYKELLDCLNNDKFSLKQEYLRMRKFLEKLKSRQKPTGNSLFDMF